MKCRRGLVWAIAIGMLALSMAMSYSAQAADDSIVVIVNSANPVNNLSLNELKKIFLSERGKWDTGKSIAPVMPTRGALGRSAFLKIVCGMSDADFNKYFLWAAFTGRNATPPQELSSALFVKSVVAGSPGAIGFINAGDFSGAESGIKAVKIDGASATDPAYKLKM